MKNGKLMAEEHHDDLGYVTRSDMTLRDWFAGQASEADIEAHTEYKYCDAFPGDTAMMRDCTREEARYRYADAMMYARKK